MAKATLRERLKVHGGVKLLHGLSPTAWGRQFMVLQGSRIERSGVLPEHDDPAANAVAGCIGWPATKLFVADSGMRPA